VWCQYLDRSMFEVLVMPDLENCHINGKAGWCIESLVHWVVFIKLQIELRDLNLMIADGDFLLRWLSWRIWLIGKHIAARICVCNFLSRYVHDEIVTIGLLFLSEEVWQYFRGVSTLRSVTSRIHEIHVRFISIHSMKLRRESVVQISMRLSSGLCFL